MILSKEQREQANEAKELLSNIVNILSSGLIEVYIKTPRRKADWAHRGFITSIGTSFHVRKIRITVAYTEGVNVKLNGKKVFVPYTDMYNLEELNIIRILNPPTKKEENEQTSV